MLPILLSIPHGGVLMPEELGDRVCITPRDQFDDSDAYTRDIYDLGEDVAHVVATDIARAFVDVNRAPDDRPPRNPDGAVKTATCFNRPIYRSGREPDDAVTQMLLARYHAPYHAALATAATQRAFALALDCHSMLALAPPISSNPGRPRPLFCLSNRDGHTASHALLERVASAISQAFAVSPAEIGLNDPFKGGYITRRHGRGRVPWIQVEMNRRLYLEDPWFDRETLRVDAGRLRELRDRFTDALHALRL